MIYNIFPFFNELDLLEVRLHELNGIVDKFVLVESTVTFSGKPKPLYYAESRERFKGFGKIHHLVCDGLPGENAWAREAYQRNFLRNGLLECEKDDVILLSDADEIPKASAVRTCSVKHGDVAWFSMEHSYYYLNIDVPGNFGWARMATYGTYLDLAGAEAFKNAPWTKRVLDGGWHFAYLGGAEAVKEKIAAYSHQEYNRPPYNDLVYLKVCIGFGKDFIGGSDMKKLASLDSLPQYIRENLERFRKYIL